MQLFILFFITLVAHSSAKQLKNGPQILSDELSTSEPSQKNDKRSVTQEFNLYFTPEKVQALQAVKSTENSPSIEISSENSEKREDFYNKLIQKYYTENLKPPPTGEPQIEPARSSSNFFLPREESVYNNKPNYRQLLKDQTKLSGHAQNVQNNKFNQIAKPSVTESDFFKSASGSNSNEAQERLEKELEIILRNFQTDQSKQFDSLNQKSSKNMGPKKSAVEEEIEKAWRQHQAFEFERSNSPADISKQSFSLSVSNENPENTEERKQIKNILRNGQAYNSERLNAPRKVNNQDSQGRKELHNDSEIERKIEKFWKKQHDSQFQRFLRNENKEMSEVDKQIEDIFIPQAFVYERLNSPPAVSYQNPSGTNKNEDITEAEKQIELFFRNRQPAFERENAPEVNSESPLVTDQNKSIVEKEIQDILKKHQDFENQRSKSAAEPNNQRLPIKFHEHVSISKHVAVPVLKTVQVSVPTPVLVPIPQPYEVKVPHLYPVPLKVVKHVPVTVVNRY